MASKNLGSDKRHFEKTLKEARIGHRESQYEVALMYANGVGVTQDMLQAIEWVRQSAERGFAPAQYLLATRFSAGEVVTQDDHQALKWLLKAAEQDHPKAIYKLAKFYSTSHARAARELCQVAANAGVAQAQFEIATKNIASDAINASAEQSFLWYRQAAEQGHAAAQCALADYYAKGSAVAQDLAMAYAWYRKAARQFHIEAQVALAMLDVQGNGRGNLLTVPSKRYSGSNNRRRNEQNWNTAGAAGDAKAKYQLGLMYQNGWGVDQDDAQCRVWFVAAAALNHAPAQLALARLSETEHDFQQALSWYKKQAVSGDSEACAALGRFYWFGLGTSQDEFMALVWTFRAAQAGQKEALKCLGQWFATEPQRIIQSCLLKAAQADSAPAQCALGLIYSENTDMSDKKLQARDWFVSAAEQGDAKAQWNLALMLVSGTEGVKKDMKQAFVLCQQAALQGFVPAQASLGILYARMKKHHQAVEWWRMAAEQGDPEAQFNLANAYSKGQGVQPDEVQAADWLSKAAEQGVVSAQAKLGLLYATGAGVASDPIEAHKWFEIASQKGDPAAQENAQRSSFKLTAVQLIEARRRARSWLGSVSKFATTGKVLSGTNAEASNLAGQHARNKQFQ